MNSPLALQSVIHSDYRSVPLLALVACANPRDHVVPELRDAADDKGFTLAMKQLPPDEQRGKLTFVWRPEIIVLDDGTSLSMPVDHNGGI